MTDAVVSETLVTAETSQGVEIRGTIVRLTRYLVAFEIYNPSLVLRLSEVLTSFRILASDQPLYAGRAVINNLMTTATLLVCEVSLEEAGWVDVDFNRLRAERGALAREYGNFIRAWQKNYKV